MRKTLLTILSFFLLATTSFGMNLKLQDEILNILVEFEKGELQVENKFESAKLVYLNRWPDSILESFGDNLSAYDFYIEDDYITKLSYTDPSGEYSVQGKIQRSLEVNAGGEKAYIAYYLFIGGEWGREYVYHEFFVLNDMGDIVLNGIYERDTPYWEVQEDWDF